MQKLMKQLSGGGKRAAIGALTGRREPAKGTTMTDEREPTIDDPGGGSTSPAAVPTSDAGPRSGGGRPPTAR
jgi:hypothetical protein